MNSFKKKDKKVKKSKKRKDKKHKKDKKRRRSSSSSSSSSSSGSSSSDSSSSSSSDEKHRRKKQKKHHKSKSKDIRQIGEPSTSRPAVLVQQPPTAPHDPDDDFSIPIGLMDNKAKAPETKEEYEKRQSIIRRVIDPDTGRSRMVKGDGEILEFPITSKEKYREIQKQATKTDGEVYESRMIGWAISNKK